MVQTFACNGSSFDFVLKLLPARIVQCFHITILKTEAFQNRFNDLKATATQDPGPVWHSEIYPVGVFQHTSWENLAT